MNGFLLTPAEVRVLTGRTHRTSQVVVLRQMGIEHKVRPDGSVVVLRAHVERVLGEGVSGAASATRRKTAPDLSMVTYAF